MAAPEDGRGGWPPRTTRRSASAGLPPAPEDGRGGRPPRPTKVRRPEYGVQAAEAGLPCARGLRSPQPPPAVPRRGGVAGSQALQGLGRCSMCSRRGNGGRKEGVVQVAGKVGVRVEGGLGGLVPGRLRGMR